MESPCQGGKELTGKNIDNKEGCSTLRTDVEGMENLPNMNELGTEGAKEDGYGCENEGHDGHNGLAETAWEEGA